MTTKSKPLLAVCNEGCNKPFQITKMITRKVKNGIDKTYFRCTHCKTVYVSHYASAETLKLQKEIRKFHREAYAPGSTMTGDEINSKEAELKAKIKQSMDEAKAIAEG